MEANHMSTRRSQTSDIAERFPALLTLAESYVNVEWDEFGDPAGAVAAFAEDLPDQAACAAEGISAVLDEWKTEAERYAVLDGLGWGYGAPPGALEEFLLWSRSMLLGVARTDAAPAPQGAAG
jgi:hypothetical protein